MNYHSKLNKKIPHGIMFHHFHDKKKHKKSQGTINKHQLSKIIKFIGRENILDAEQFIEGHLIVYYQHGIENKLVDIRHSNDIEVSNYNHSCLKQSHTCVDLIQGSGKAKGFRKVIEMLQDTVSVDKVVFVSAPMREEGCC